MAASCNVLILSLLVVLATANKNVINVDYKTGMDNLTCLTTSSSVPCKTLMYTLLNLNISNSIEVHISSGMYGLSDLIQLENMENFEISGEGINSTLILCNSSDGAGGIRFTTSESILISNVTFNGCGGLVESLETASAAITFSHCKDASLNGVHVTQSVYSGALYDSCKGTLTILDSYFTVNGNSNNNDNNELMCISGGAVSITLAYNDTETTTLIAIESSQFIGNHANTGGAVYIETDQMDLSDITIANSLFKDNLALLCKADSKNGLLNGAGGAISLFITPSYSAHNNNVTIIKSTFSNNTAVSGAGVQYLIRSAKDKVQQILPLLSITQSMFNENTANIGSTIVLTPVGNLNNDGFLYWTKFEGNIIIDNTVQAEGAHTGLGTILVRNINIVFTGINQFIGNKGSAIALLNAILQFGKGSDTRFIGNAGFNGGAVYLSGESSLRVDSNTSLVFRDNFATNQGGAIYHFTQDTIWTLSRVCFIEYVGDSNETSNFTFEDNKVRNETNAIYSNDVSACKNNESLDSLLFCQDNWLYVSSDCSESVHSEPVDLLVTNYSTNDFELFSGVHTVLPVLVTNIFGINVTENVVLSASVNPMNVTTNPAILNNAIELNGKVNTSGELHLQTNNRIGASIPYNIRSCPPGFVQELDGFRCKCVENAFVQGAINCNNEQLTSALVVTNCISQFGQNDSRLVAGTCPFLLGTVTSAAIELPQDASKVEESVCGTMNRRGVLCGECKQGYSPAAYSYLYNCIKCDNKIRSWIVYIVGQYLPIVLLFILITSLNLTIVSPASNAFLFFAQVSSLSNAYTYSSFVAKYSLGETSGYAVVDTYNTIYGIWNIDFFRAFLPPICLFDGQGALIVVFLEYAASFFPFILVMLTYILIVLYNKNFRLLVWIWRPFGYCLKKVQNKFQSRTSLVDVFVTFFFLSYLKIVATTFRFLQYVFVYDINGNILEVVYLYNGNIKMFQGMHLPFAILAIVTLITVVLFPPVLLTCYQFRWFQKILEKLHLRNQALITFVEVIQSGFTDGRDGTKDRRFFAGFYFILRIILFGPTTVIPEVFIVIIVPPVTYTLGLIMLVVFQPYQNNFFNKLDVVFLLLFIISTNVFILSLFLTITGAPSSSIAPFIYLIYTLGYIPLLYMIGYVIKWIVTVAKLCGGRCVRNEDDEDFTVIRRQTRNAITSSLYSIPDRIIQPEFYQSLIVSDNNTCKTDTTNKTDTNSDKTNSTGRTSRTNSSITNATTTKDRNDSIVQYTSPNIQTQQNKKYELSTYSY